MAKEKEKETKPQEGDLELGEQKPENDDHLNEDIVKALSKGVEGQEEQEEEGEEEEKKLDVPETVKITIGGHTVEVSKEVAEAYEQEETTRRSVEQESPKKKEESEQTGQDELAELLFTDPKEAIKRIQEQTKTELREEYQMDKSREAFWDMFYQENPELKEDDSFVKSTLNTNMSVLENMKGKAARDRLAELTQREILKIAERHSKGTSKRTTANTLEGGTASKRKQAIVEEEEKPNKRPLTLGDAIKQRRLERARLSRGVSTN